MLEIRQDIVEAMLVLNDVSSLGLSPDWRTGISTPQRRKEVGEGWAGALIIHHNHLCMDLIVYYKGVCEGVK